MLDVVSRAQGFWACYCLKVGFFCVLECFLGVEGLKGFGAGGLLQGSCGVGVNGIRVLTDSGFRA